MKKLFTLFLLSAIFLSSAIFSAKAASTCSSTDAYSFEKCSGVNDLGQTAGYNVGAATTPEYYVGLVLSIFFSLLGLIFMILTIYAGIKWMTAQGNNSQIGEAKDTLTRAIIGLVICIVAYGITYFVINMFQGNSQGGPVLDNPVQNSSTTVG